MAALSANNSSAKIVAIFEIVIERLLDYGASYSTIGIYELELV